jgi:hypothetical protein
MKKQTVELPNFCDQARLLAQAKLWTVENNLNIAAAYQRYALRELRKPDLSKFAKCVYPVMLEWADRWIDQCHYEALMVCGEYSRGLKVRHNSTTRLWRLEVV